MSGRPHTDAPLVAGPVLAWRAWALGGRRRSLRLLPVAGSRRPWPPRRPVKALCSKAHLHRVPDVTCTCGVHATREIDLLRETRGPAVVGTVALWGTLVEHELGYRARFAYPQAVTPVCSACFWRPGTPLRPGPTVVATVPGGRLLPLCERHLQTAFEAHVRIRDITPADEAMDVLVETYGIASRTFRRGAPRQEAAR